MRISLQLSTEKVNAHVPFNYQYPLSSAIYKIISRADNQYATFLHEQGYQKEGSLKTFKLFTFSDLNTAFERKDDRMVLTGHNAQLTICFHMPEAATNFIKGLFLNQIIDIADSKSKTSFVVSQVEMLPQWQEYDTLEDMKEVILKPISPIVVGVINNKKKYDFLYPHDDRFIPALMHHWREKYEVVYGNSQAQSDFDDMEISVINPEKAKARLITIKSGTPAETKIRGMVNFRLHVKSRPRVLELGLDAGIGVYSSQGMGCIEII